MSRVIMHPLACADCGSTVVGAVEAIEGAESRVGAARDELPPGVAANEAVVTRLRRDGLAIETGAATPVPFEAFLLRMSSWGADSLRLVRAKKGLASELKIGTWTQPPLAERVRRRITLTLPAKALVRISNHAAAGETAFWRGVRAAATPDEWRWLTASYSVLVYHRLAGERRPEQLRIDMPADTFHRQLEALRRARISVLTADDVVAFHLLGTSLPARRATVITIDDATADTIEPLAAGRVAMQLFVVTGDVGRRAAWLGDTPLADWDDLRRLERLGVVVGAHSRSHPPDLTALDDNRLDEEVAGSRSDLAEALGRLPALFAYPHGRFDEHVQRVVAAAGYDAAYSTQPGRNGLGTDRFGLRRVSVKAWDTRASLLWKVVTGEPVPALWEGWLALRRRLGRGRRSSRTCTD